MVQNKHHLRTRLTALLLALVCVLGLFPEAAFAASDTITLKAFGHSGVGYNSAALGHCTLHEMTFKNGSKNTTGFCGTKGGGMGSSLRDQTWGHKTAVSNPTVEIMMAYYYAHSTGVFTDAAKALGTDDIWDSGYTWYMNAWVQACIWRWKQGSMSDPVAACAEELMAVYNTLENTHYTSIDQKRDNISFRDRAQYIIDLGTQGVWGKCAVYEYTFTGAGSSSHPASSVQKIVLGDLTVEQVDQEEYAIIVKKVDSSNPNKALPGAGFHVESQNGSFTKDVITGPSGTYRINALSAGTYAVTETFAPDGYEIDSAAPQYVTLPSNGSNTVTVTFRDSIKITGEGSIRKVDADDPSKGLAGAVIKITGVDNSFTGTYTTGEGGWLTDVPWSSMPVGSYTAEEVTPPEGYSKSPDQSKVKQSFHWNGKNDVALVFENDAKVKVQLMKLDDSNNPLPGAVFNIIKDGKIIGTEATDENGSIIVTDVTEGMYAFVEVSAPAPYARLTDPVIAHVDQATISGGGTVTVSAADKKLPNLSILKRDAQTGEVIPNTNFEIRSIHYGYHTDVTTGADGKAVLTGIPVDSYEITEKSVPDPYVVGDEPIQTIWLEAGDNKELIFDNLKQPTLKISKIEKGTNRKIPGTVFTVEAIDGDCRQDVTTGADGTVTLRIMPGSYRVTEKSVPDPYVVSGEPTQTISLNAGDEKELIFENQKQPTLKISKVEKGTNTKIPGTVFTVEAINGDYRQDVTTGADGTVTLRVMPGSYRVTEKSVPEPYVVSDDPTQTISLNAGDDKELIFENQKQPLLRISKIEKGSNTKIPGTVFLLEAINGDYRHEVTTGVNGWVELRVAPGSYRVTEKSVPDPYVISADPTQTISLNAGDEKELVFENQKKPLLRISKIEKGTNTKIPGTVFLLEAINGDYRQNVTTGADGWVELRVAPGSYRITEQSVPEPYVIGSVQTKTISLNPGDEKEVTFENLKKPELTIAKIDADSGEVIPGTVFRVEAVNGDYQDDWTTGEDGTVTKRVEPGTYRVTEKSVPAPYFLPDRDADRVQTVSLNAGDVKRLTFRNRKAPELTIFKEDSVAGAPIEGVKFHVTYTSNGEAAEAPATIDFGYIFTDAHGKIKLHEQGKRLYPGEYTITEIAPAPGYQMKEPLTQTVIIHGNESKTVTFQNEPLNAIVVEKYDSVTHAALPGCVFQLRYLSGTSGTGGTVIGQKTTGPNGTTIWTGLKAGTYILEEIDPADGYSIINSSETVYLSENGEQSVITVRFDNMPDGNLLIRKMCSVNPSVTLANAEFKIMYADGTLIGDSNGIYRTDENGEIRIEGLKPGSSVIVTEIKAPAGFLIDTQSQTIQIKEGRTVTLTFKNQPKGELIVQKRDSITGQPLPGAEFRITTAAGCEVGLNGVIGTATLTQNGLFRTDSNGEIRISNLAPGAYVLTEIKAPAGYIMDSPSTNVVIGTNGDTQTVIVTNTPKGGLIVTKYDSVTRQPLAGAQFKIMAANGELTADNEGLTSSNGLYTTNVNGQIVLSRLNPGAYIVTEEKAPDNYRKDPTPQTVVVNAGDTQTLRFYDDPLCTLTILKRDAVTRKPLANAEFYVRDSEGRAVGPNNGRYVTGTDGTVTVSGLQPNATIVVSETKTPTGYILDETPKNIVVRSGVANSLTFDNEPGTTLVIQKFIEGTENEPLSGVGFKVVDGAGAAVGPDDGVYYTDAAGEIVLTGIEPGTTVKVREIKTVDGFVLNGTPQDILIKAGEVQRLTFWNKRAGTLVIQKKDKVSGNPIAGAEFQLTYASGGYVDNDNGHLSSNGIYTTDEKGEIRISGVVGSIVTKEIKAAPGYVIDQSTQTQTVTVNPMDTQTLRFYNDPLCSLTLTKLDSVTGKPVPGTEFTVKDGDGSVFGRYTTGNDGTVTVTGLVPGSTVVVSESRVPNGYVLNQTPQTIIVKNGNGNSYTSSISTNEITSNGGTGTTSNGNGLTFENDPKMTLTIHKYIEGTANEPLAGVAFKIVDGSGKPLNPDGGIYYTDNAGKIVLEDLEPGATITAQEIKTVEGYVLDGRPQSIKIEAGKTQNLTFWNKRDCSLTILKQSTSKEPLTGAVFHVTDEDGAAIGTNNGRYTTDRNGLITITGLQPGQVLVVTEERAPNGYVLDTTPKTIKIKQDVANRLIFENAKAGSLVINKRSSLDKKTPLEGVTFKITTSSGEFLPDETGKISSNGLYYTDEAGQIILNSVVGTLVVTEVQSIDGYTIREVNRSQTVEVKPDDTQTIYFYNDPLCSLTLTKLDSVTGKPIPNTEFTVKDGNGNLIGRYTTGQDGTAVVTGLVSGSTVTVSESRVPNDYVLNTAPKTITIKSGSDNRLAFENDPKVTLTLHKYIEGTENEPLSGVAFKVTDGNGKNIGPSNSIFYTDKSGNIVLEGLEPGTTIIAREIKTVEGFVLDGSPQTIKIEAGKAASLTFWNKRDCSLTILKQSTSKEPLTGAVFHVTDEDGAAIGTNNGRYTTDRNGLITITGLQPGQVLIVTEEKAPNGYVRDVTPKTIKIKQDVANSLIFENAKAGSLVINKRSSVDKKTPLEGVTFKITTTSGEFLPDETGKVSSNGLYYTDEAGQIILNGVVGTLVVTEMQTIDGYTIHAANRSQTVEVKPDDTQTIYFYNDPLCSLTLTKLDSVTGKPVPDTEFTVKDGDGNILGRYTTGADGTVTVTGLIPGSTVVVSESRVPDGYVLNTSPKTIIVKNGSGNSYTSGMSGNGTADNSSSGTASNGNGLTFENDPKMTLTIHKYIEGTANEPLAGVAFKVVDGSGKPIGSNGGVYYTNAAGEIIVEDLEPGTSVTAQEIKTVDGYVLDGNPKTVKIEAGKTASMTFWNKPAGSLIIRKLDKQTGKPLVGVEFELVYAKGGYVDTDNGHLSSKGLYTTDDHGEIHISGVTGTIVVKETRPLSGYTIEPGRESQTVTVDPQETQTLTFYNIPANTLTIEKYLETETGNEPLRGVTFLVTDSYGAFVGNSNGEFITDENGRVVIANLTPGTTITAKEIKVPEGVVLDSTPKSILIKEGEAQVLRFTNKMAGTLVIHKLDKLTNKPLAGVEFEITYAGGGFVDAANGHLSSNGRYTTNDAGEIRISGVTGTIVVKEVKCLPGYTIDPATQIQTVKVNPADTQTLTFYNIPGTTLTIQKLITGTKDKPLAGVEFLITDSSGAHVGPNQGIYRTDEYGRIMLTDLKPGTVITAKETKTVDGFVLDSTPKSIEIKEGEAQTLTFYNAPVGGLELIKVSESDKTQRIPNVKFEIRKMDGALVKTITTDSTGRVHADLDSGDYYAVEIETAKGFKLDSTPQYFTIRDNETTTLTVTNKPFSGIMIHKVDSITKKGIYGVTFLLYDSTNTPVGQYTSDNSGYVYIEGITTAGRYYLRELENKGYITDTQMKTVYVKPGETTLVEWENTPITGQIQITKKSADYNSTNGLPAGTLLEGAVFEIYDKASNLVDTIRSDSRGLAVSRQLPLGRYTIRETKAPANYGVNDTVLTAYLEHEGEIVRFEVTNKSMTTGVAITKTGPVEVMAGQPVRYVLSGIANSSNVRLDNFYWRDTLPAEVRLDKIVTGTYNFPGTYKITYRVNGGEARTLADSLSTQKNYTLAASATALGLASNERVTEIMFVFGQAPAGFAQVEKPVLYCSAVSSIATKSFVNKADVGGTYNGVWVQAVSRWETKVYGKPVTVKLPRTGY